MDPSDDDKVRQGLAALEARDWRRARELLESVSEPAAEVFDALAHASYWLGDYPASLAAHERAYRQFLDRGDKRSAAMTARGIAWLQAGVYGSWSVMQGWYSRAAALFDESGEGSAHGWAANLRAGFSSDRAERSRLAARALDAAAHHGALRLEVTTSTDMGRPTPPGTGEAINRPVARPWIGARPRPDAVGQGLVSHAAASAMS